MRLLMLDYEFPPLGGGAGMVNYFLCKEFAHDTSMTIDLVTSSTRSYRKETFSDNITIHYLDIGKHEDHHSFQSNRDLVTYSLKALPYCKKLVKRQSYDLIHAVMGVPAGYIASRLGLPFVVSLHGSDVPFHNPRFRSLDRWILKRSSRWMWKKAARVVAVSHDLAQRARRSAPDQSIETIYTGVDTRTFVPPEDLLKQDNDFRILYVGRLSEVKAPNLLLDAFMSISQVYPLATVDFVGDGPMLPQLKAQVRAEKLTDRVTFHGKLPFESLPAMYAQAHVQVVPSLNEALGNIVLEAMACGLPVITSKTGAAELIDKNGIVTAKGDSPTIVSALKTLMDDPALRHDMAKQSLKLSANYTWDCVADRFKALYTEAIATPS